MVTTIDMKYMRYINLFAKTTRVLTKHVFEYNNALIFAVPKSKLSQAIGKEASNIKKMSQILRKKIKVVILPKEQTPQAITKFIQDIVAPIELTKVELIDNKAQISTNKLDKATLIGRNHTRHKELETILKRACGISELKIN